MSDHVTIDLRDRGVVSSSDTGPEISRDAAIANTARQITSQENHQRAGNSFEQDGVDEDDTFYSAHDGKSATGRFLHGSKPPWGWDYVLAFKMPKTLRQKFCGEVAASKCPEGRLSDCEKDRDVSQNNSDLGPETNDDISISCGIEKSVMQTRKRVEILARLKSAGFVFSQLAIPSEGVILVRISLPEQCLREKARHLGLELKLKSNYGGGYLAYSPEYENAFVNEPAQSKHKCFFSPADRAIIILAVLQSKEHWGCDLDIERLVFDQTVLQVFALHSLPERDELVHRAVWHRFWDPTWKPPLNDLKNYLGGPLIYSFFLNLFSYVIISTSARFVATNGHTDSFSSLCFPSIQHV